MNYNRLYPNVPKLDVEEGWHEGIAQRIKERTGRNGVDNTAITFLIEDRNKIIRPVDLFLDHSTSEKATLFVQDRVMKLVGATNKYDFAEVCSSHDLRTPSEVIDYYGNVLNSRYTCFVKHSVINERLKVAVIDVSRKE